MDQKDLNSSSDYSELSSQYQDILEKYSQELANKNAAPQEPVNTEPVNTEPVEVPPMLENNPPLELPPPPIEPAQTEPVEESPATPPEPISTEHVNTEPVNTEPVNTEHVEVPPIPTSDEISLPPNKSSSFFKVLFFLSLVLFLGVAAVVAYTFFIEPQNNAKLNLTEETLVDVTPSPTVVSGPVCELNDKTYPVGESFTATDNCNTCTCGEDLLITCTDNACPSATPTETSTVSATPATKTVN